MFCGSKSKSTKRNKVKVSGRQKDKKALERIKESNVRLSKNGLTLITKIGNSHEPDFAFVCRKHSQCTTKKFKSLK